MNHYDNKKICRICLKDHNKLCHLFGKVKGVSPYEKLMKINMKVDIDQSEKSYICVECLSDLDVAVDFIERCEKANLFLLTRNIYKDNINEASVPALELNQLEPLYEYPQNDKATLIEEKSKGSNQDFKINIDLIKEASCPECGSKRPCRHWRPAKRHTCQYCQKVFNRKFDFKLHLKRHLGEREWPCPKCGTQHITRNLAEKHCSVKPRKACPVPGCGKSYTTITNLNIHVRMHKGERPFKCDYCGDEFARKNTLVDHIRIHTGEKPYICPVCGKQFRTNRLTVHLWTHEDMSVRPYVCQKPGCTKRFGNRTALQHHSAVHSGRSGAGARARAHHCSPCGLAYAHSQSLRKHLRIHHSQKANEPAHSENQNLLQKDCDI